MGIVLASQFTVNAALPLDDRMVVADSTARDAITSGRRFEGMIVYSVADATNFQLVGGIANTNWVQTGGSAGKLKTYASDAAFVAANGTAVNGNIYYNTATDSVRLYAAGAWTDFGTGGAGGMQVTWLMGDAPPLPTLLYNNASGSAFDFDNSGGQQLYAAIKVPNGYKAGKPITMRSQFLSADTTGNVWFKTTATLIRLGMDLITSTTNQRLSTNAAITQSTLNGKPQTVVNDITDTTGNINSVAVSPGDLILLTFARAIDTSTLAATLLAQSSEITFV